MEKAKIQEEGIAEPPGRPSNQDKSCKIKVRKQKDRKKKSWSRPAARAAGRSLAKWDGEGQKAGKRNRKAAQPPELPGEFLQNEMGKAERQEKTMEQPLYLYKSIARPVTYEVKSVYD